MQQEQKVPENVARKIARDERLRQERTKAREQRRAHLQQRRAHLVAKGEQYQKEYAAAERETVEQSRKARNEGGFYVPAEAKLILVTRIRG